MSLGWTLAVTGCYASHGADGRGDAVDAAALDARALDGGRDARTTFDGGAALDVSGGLPDVGRDAGPSDAGPPRCDPTTVVWAHPAPWVCGDGFSPDIRVIPTDGWGSSISASACGLVSLADHGSFPIGGTARWTDSVVSGYDHDLAPLWDVTTTERPRAILALPDLDFVVRLGVDVHDGWGGYTGARPSWRVEPPIHQGVDPHDSAVDPDGTVHTYAAVTDGSPLGLDRGAGLAELVIASTGSWTARWLARGALDSLTAVRGPRERVYLTVPPSELTWLDGTVTVSGTRSLLVVLEANRVVLTQPSAGLVLPHDDEAPSRRRRWSPPAMRS